MKQLRSLADLQWWPIWIGCKTHVINIKDFMGLRLITIGIGDVSFDKSIAQKELS